MSAFIRDAQSGGCSIGAPPDNLGFRLVRDPDVWVQVIEWVLASGKKPPLITGTSLGGDADSVGAVAGTLAGAA